MIDLGKRNVLGIGVNAIDYEAAVARVIKAGKNRRSDGRYRSRGPRCDDRCR